MTQATPSPSQGSGTLARVHRLLRSNWITSLGAALMTLAVMGGVTVLAMQAFGEEWAGPYVGIVLTILAPGVFLLGLVLVPCGLLVYRKQLHARVAALADRPMYLARAVVVLTAINFASIATVGYSGVHYMSSNQFCGLACHSAMQPEWVAYQDSPHNRVDCVKCHVGPTAAGYVEAKLNGVKQLVGYVTDDYHRPIPTPVHNLVSAKETCESCHWPEKYLGTKLLLRTHYREDEQVSGFTNVLLMKTGGTGPDGRSVGIHWHVHPEAVVEYVARDDKRMDIPWVRVVKPDGVHDTFAIEGYDHDTVPEGHHRSMDCNDCHNRSAHDFEMPGAAIDRHIAAGLIPRSLPFVKKHALEALQGDWTREGAGEGIRRHMQQAYAKEGRLDESVRGQLEPVIEKLTELWTRNVYPERKVLWGSYPSLSTHDGCFRCHDDKHKTKDGRVISKDCAICHVVLSENEEDPIILKTLGVGR